MKQTVVARFVASFFVIASLLAIPLFFTTSPAEAANCGTHTAIIDCPGVNNNTTDITKSGLWAILLIGINVLTALVGVAALAGIIYGAVLYTTSAGDQGKAEKAIEVFRNVVIGIVTYILMYVGLNFIIPGGVFN